VATVAGDIRAVLRAVADHRGERRDHESWLQELRDAETAAAASDAQLLAADSSPIKPSRIYGELGKRLADDAVVICDGGDFASYAGKFVEVERPAAGSTPARMAASATAWGTRPPRAWRGRRARWSCSSATVLPGSA
jgi:acetolactate synthase-1/2/3 large subunit